MLLRYATAIAFVLAAASPALADECGSAPLAPAMPTVAEVGSAAPAEAASKKHNAFLDIKNWQGSLKTYRDCLDAEKSKDENQIASAQASNDKDSKTKIAALQDAILDNRKAFNGTVDAETEVVNDFAAMSAAYCKRTDVDRASCPKT